MSGLSIAALALRNFGPFRGETSLALRPTHYGVVARRAGPVESNGAGKSMLLEAFLFAAGGWTNPDRMLGAEGWVSDGEPSGAVRVDLSDRYWFERSRKVGSSTKVRTSTGATGDAADAEIAGRLGFSTGDLLATRYVRQRDAAKFALLKPEPRLRLVSEWFRLDPLERAEKRARDAAVEAEDGVARERAELARLRDLLAGSGGSEEAVEGARGALAVRESERKRASEAWFAGEAARGVASLRQGLDEMVREGRRLVAEAASRPPAEEARRVEEQKAEERAVARSRKDAASERLRDLLVVTTRGFDGTCPVARMPCPARAEVERKVRGDQEIVATAERESDEAERVERALGAQESEARRAADGALAAARAIAELRERVAKVKAAIDAAGEVAEAGDREATSAALMAANNALVDAKVALDQAEARREERVARERSAERIAALVGGADAVAARHREAAAIFRAARRAIAGPAIATVEERACAALGELGIGLGFRLSWAREGRDPARECGRCGRPFPASAKAKQCGHCAAPRGLHQVERLDVLMTAQGGAFEDLVGLTAQLAAGAWLARDRESAFATAWLDEVGSHFDPSVRRAFARRLPAVLGALGVEQSFVVSHTSETTDSLPARIVVEAGPDGFATARVEG